MGVGLPRFLGAFFFYQKPAFGPGAIIFFGNSPALLCSVHAGNGRDNFIVYLVYLSFWKIGVYKYSAFLGTVFTLLLRLPPQND